MAKQTRPPVASVKPASKVRSAPNRSVTRPAGTPDRAAAIGPTAITMPVMVSLRPRPNDKKKGPTIRVAIMIALTMTFIVNEDAIARLCNRCKGRRGQAARFSIRTNTASATTAKPRSTQGGMEKPTLPPVAYNARHNSMIDSQKLPSQSMLSAAPIRFFVLEKAINASAEKSAMRTRSASPKHRSVRRQGKAPAQYRSQTSCQADPSPHPCALLRSSPWRATEAAT